jgi:hypothetical protein
MPPPFSPTLCAPRIHARCTDHPTAVLPYTRRAAPGLPLAVSPRTVLAPYRDPCRQPGYPFPKAQPPIKAASVPHARAPDPPPRPPLPPPLSSCSARCRGRLNASSFPSCTARACTPALCPDHLRARARAPAAAAEQPPTSPTLRLLPGPTNLSWTSTRSQRSYPCHTLFSPAPILTEARAPAAAPPLLHRRRSPVTLPAEPSVPIEHGYAELQPGAACCPSPAPHCRR